MAWGAVVVMVGAKIGPVVLAQVGISDVCVGGVRKKGIICGVRMMTRKYFAAYPSSSILSLFSSLIRSAISSVSSGMALDDVGGGASAFERVDFFSFFFSFFFSNLRSCAISSSSSESEASSELVLSSSSEEASSSNQLTFQMWFATAVILVKGNGVESESLGLL